MFFKNLSFYNELYTVRLGAILEPFWHREGSMAEPSRAEPARDEPSRVEPGRAEPSRAEPSRAEPSRAEPSRAEPGRAEPSQARPSWPSRAGRSKGDPKTPTGRSKRCPKSPGVMAASHHFWDGDPPKLIGVRGQKEKKNKHTQTQQNTTSTSHHSRAHGPIATPPSPTLKFVTPRVEFVFV